MLSNSADTDEKVNFPSDEVKVYLNDTTKEIQNGNLGKKEAVTVNQTIKLFTELGNLRKEKTLKKATSEILNLIELPVIKITGTTSRDYITYTILIVHAPNLVIMTGNTTIILKIIFTNYRTCFDSFKVLRIISCY
ncbi:hypothetical protein [Ligilactobacillus salivarius]|uniref:hypothetical protein n=1 Tax=Ligilactobacillus salivarius TaxID=1624 RepID=UPI001CDAF4C8|nr:hypothetical protein [Ligilactobacillus salivarius]